MKTEIAPRTETRVALFPKDIDTSENFCNSVWNDRDMEKVAEWIVKYGQQENLWPTFTWEWYRLQFRPNNPNAIKALLDRFVAEGFLDLSNYRYGVTPKFIDAVAKFKK